MSRHVGAGAVGLRSWAGRTAVPVGIATLLCVLAGAMAAAAAPALASPPVAVGAECARLGTGVPSAVLLTCAWHPDTVDVSDASVPAVAVSPTAWNCTPAPQDLPVLITLPVTQRFSDQLTGLGSGAAGADALVESAVEARTAGSVRFPRSSAPGAAQVHTFAALPAYTSGWMTFQPQLVTTAGRFVATTPAPAGQEAYVDGVSEPHTLRSYQLGATGALLGALTPHTAPMTDADKAAHCSRVSSGTVLLAQPGDRCGVPSADPAGSGYTVPGQPVRLLRTCAGSGSAERDRAATWTQTPVGDGTYVLADRDSGLCLATAGSSVAAGAAVVQAACSGQPTQHWRLSAAGPSGWFRWQDAGSEGSVGGPQCLTVVLGRAAAGDPLVLGACTDLSARWSQLAPQPLWPSVTLRTPGATCAAPVSVSEQVDVWLSGCTVDAKTPTDANPAYWFVVPVAGTPDRVLLRSTWSGECLSQVLPGSGLRVTPCAAGQATAFALLTRGQTVGVQDPTKKVCASVAEGAWAQGSPVTVGSCSGVGSDWSLTAPWAAVTLGMPDDRCAVPSTWPTPGSYTTSGTPIRMLTACGATTASTDPVRQAATRWYPRQLTTGAVALQNAVGALCAGSTGGALTAGTTVALTRCSSPGTAWTATASGPSVSYTISKGSSCLTPSGGAVTAGTPLVLAGCAVRKAWTESPQARRVVALALADEPQCLSTSLEPTVGLLTPCSGATSAYTYDAAEILPGTFQLGEVAHPGWCVGSQVGGYFHSLMKETPCVDGDPGQLYVADGSVTGGADPGAFALRNVATQTCAGTPILWDTVQQPDPVWSFAAEPPTSLPCTAGDSRLAWRFDPVPSSAAVLALAHDRCAVRSGSGGAGQVGAQAWLEVHTPCAGGADPATDAAMRFRRYDLPWGSVLMDASTSTCLTLAVDAPGALVRMAGCGVTPDVTRAWTFGGDDPSLLLVRSTADPSLCLGLAGNRLAVQPCNGTVPLPEAWSLTRETG